MRERFYLLLRTALFSCLTKLSQLFLGQRGKELLQHELDHAHLLCQLQEQLIDLLLGALRRRRVADHILQNNCDVRIAEERVH